MLSSTGADEAALERSYSVAPQMDVVTAEKLLRKAKRIMDQLVLLHSARHLTWSNQRQ